MKFLASLALLKDFHLAVGTLYLSINDLDHSLSDSILAAFFTGPKTFMSCAINSSAIPFAKGSSGPTATSDTWFSLQNLATCFRNQKNYDIT